MNHMTAPGSNASASPVAVAAIPAPSPGCYRVVMREPTHGWTVRPIVGAENPEHAIEKGLVLFPHSIPIHAALIHEQGPHPSSERFVQLVGRVDRRRRVA